MSRFQSFARLIRLPNLPTAFADICLGALATAALPERLITFVFLLLASGCLYCGGMVWNDFFDVAQDRKERPNRPIPSGQISRAEAGWLGVFLLLGGLGFATLAGLHLMLLQAGDVRLPPTIAALLVICILLYDGWLKRTWAGPLAMGSCRTLNVLLGVSVVGNLAWPRGPHLAVIVGLYIVGITWFARTEAKASSRAMLQAAAAVMLAALLLALPLPLTNPAASSVLFPYLLIVVGFAVGFPVSEAIKNPGPRQVQAAVKRSLQCLIFLDAVLASACVGTPGLLLLGLMAPSIYLNRRQWLYAT